MDQHTAAYVVYVDTFPSDAFLQTYLGTNQLVEGNPHRGEVTSALYPNVRRIFDGVLRSAPRRKLQLELPNCSTVYVFQDGEVAPWVLPVLERRGLVGTLSPNAWQELCREFILHCQAGAFYEREWYQWQVAGDSVWIEAIPEALVGGIPPKRSLDELFDGESQSTGS